MANFLYGKPQMCPNTKRFEEKAASEVNLIFCGRLYHLSTLTPGGKNRQYNILHFQCLEKTLRKQGYCIPKSLEASNTFF